MSTYVFFDKKTGGIVHIHREYYMGANETMELDQTALMDEVGEMLPADVEIGILAVEEPLRPVRGYRHLVDLTTNQLMLVETPEPEKEAR